MDRYKHSEWAQIADTTIELVHTQEPMPVKHFLSITNFEI